MKKKSDNAKVIIKYPQIVFETKTVTVPKKLFEDLMSEKTDWVDFIWENLTTNERDWSTGKDGIDGAVEVGFCWVKDAEKVKQG